MSSKLIFLLMLLTIFAFTQGAVMFEQLTPNPRYPGKCYVPRYRKAYNFNIAYPVPDMSCAEMVCSSTYLMQYATCPVVQVPRGCRLTVNRRAPYPDCCPVPRC